MLRDVSAQAPPFASSSPQSTAGLAASLLEPCVATLLYVAILLVSGEPMRRHDTVLCLLVITLAYPGRNRFHDRPLNAVVDIAVAWVQLLAVLALCGWVTTSLRLFDMPVLLAWAALTPLTLSVLTLAGIGAMRRHVRQPENQRHAVVIGAGAQGEKVAQALRAGAFNATVLHGFFDDRGPGRGAAGCAPVLGRFDAAAAHVREHAIHDVYISLPLTSAPRIQSLVQSMQGTTASLWYVPDVFGVTVIQGRLREINGLPVVGLCETPFTGVNALVKRASDVAMCLLLLPVLLPLMAAVAVGVKWSSPGPVLFRQRRNGMDGKEIVVWKFRSMRVMEDGAQVTQATPDDPRVTPFGAFIRRTSLDELPQFLNVLQGRMSIVGPRPHAVAHNELYAETVRAYMVRHKVKPGITGLAQVSGLRGRTDTIEKMVSRVEADLAYMRNWSLSLDMQIIARTVKLVFFDRTAY